ncbi:MAG: ComEC/Rec2 family competence protein [Proteobacteria bacterium]|nr:ComEC/Rec2 family competence protein [Pseudomonadota bacterium]
MAIALSTRMAALAWLGRLAAMAEAERARWALWLPAAFATGIGIYFALPFEPSRLFGGVVATLGLASAILSARLLWTVPRVILALLAAISFGFANAKLRTEWVAAPVLAHQIGPIRIDARVDQAEPKGKGIRLVLSEIHTGRLAPVPRHIRVTVRAATPLPAPGSWVHVTAVLMPPPSPAAPGGYDFGRAAYYMQLGAVGYTYGRPKPIASLRPDTWLERWQAGLESLRNGVTQRIRAMLPGPEGAIAAALITGERSSVDPSDVQAYRDSGLMHVLSISGLHLALAGGIFFWVLRALLAAIPYVALRYPIKKWAAMLALASSTFYLLISGCEAPALRSWIMLALMFTAILFDRPAITMRNVALAATLLLLIEPESLLEPGFEMSFAAVIGLIAFGEWEATRGRDAVPPGILRRIWRYFAGIAMASIVAGLATAPFVIFHFGRSAQYGILSNLLSLPIAGFVIMPAAAVAMVLMPFGLDHWPLVAMGKGVALMSAVAHWVAQLPGATASLAAWPLSALLPVVFGGLWLTLWTRRWRWFGLAPIALGLVLAWFARPPDILIARDGVTVAIRAPSGRLTFLVPPKDDYSAAEWLKRDGDARLPDDALVTPADKIACDTLGCIATTAGDLEVAYIARADAFAEDCSTADVVIAAIPARGRCKGPKLVIDRLDVARANAHAIWFGPTLRAESVEAIRGQRPWTSPQYRRINPTSLPWTRTRSAP